MAASSHAEMTAALFPSALHVPANLLRLHLQFGASANVADALDAVRLVAYDGRTVEEPFLDLGDGMWDASGTRMTLLMHPGRIKSGLAAQRTLGAALRPGQDYRLEVDLVKLFGEPGEAAGLVSYPLSVTQPLTDPIDLREWRVSEPRAGSMDKLVVEFDRPMDRFGLEDAFALLDPHGRPVPLQMTVRACERAASLQPLRAWQNGPHRLYASPEIEDVAGNRIGEAFETDGAFPTAAVPTSLTVRPRKA